MMVSFDGVERLGSPEAADARRKVSVVSSGSKRRRNGGMKKSRKGKKGKGPMFRLVIFVVGSILGASVSLLVVASKRETQKIEGKKVGEHTFNGILVNLISECIKLIVSAACYSYIKMRANSGKPADAMEEDDNLSDEGRLESFRVSLLYAVPALLYTVDNNLIFLILEYLDPAEMSILWNFKIVTTAVLFRIFFGRSLSLLKWAAVLLLFFGVFSSQSTKLDMARVAIVSGQDICGNDMNVTAPDAPHPAAEHHDYLKGVILVLVGTTITSLAGVYTEWVLKHHRKVNFFKQNMISGAYSVVCNFFAFLLIHPASTLSTMTTQAASATPSPFARWNAYTWLLPFAQASFGLVTSSIFKYLNNILNVFKNATSMLIISLVSWALFDFHMTIAFVTGFAIVVLALLIYNVDAETVANALLDERLKRRDVDDDDDENADEDEEARLLWSEEASAPQ